MHGKHITIFDTKKEESITYHNQVQIIVQTPTPPCWAPCHGLQGQRLVSLISASHPGPVLPAAAQLQQDPAVPTFQVSRGPEPAQPPRWRISLSRPISLQGDPVQLHTSGLFQWWPLLIQQRASRAGEDEVAGHPKGRLPVALLQLLISVQYVLYGM